MLAPTLEHIELLLERYGRNYKRRVDKVRQSDCVRFAIDGKAGVIFIRNGRAEIEPPLHSYVLETGWLTELDLEAWYTGAKLPAAGTIRLK